jgi:predicted DNA-binding transcriptional regulator YafY
LRPQLVELCEGNEFVFKCTEAQAEFYFFKFGKDAEILEPEELRNKLANMYDEALRMYMKNKQDEREVI